MPITDEGVHSEPLLKMRRFNLETAFLLMAMGTKVSMSVENINDWRGSGLKKLWSKARASEFVRINID